MQFHAANIADASNQIVESGPDSEGRASKTGASGQGRVGHHDRYVSPGQINEHSGDESDDAPNYKSDLRGHGANAFIGLMGSDEDHDEDDTKNQASKISGTNPKAANAFAGLLGSDESDESEDDTEELAPPDAESSRSRARASKAANAFAGLIDSDEAEDSDEGDGEGSAGVPAGAEAASAFAGLMEDSSADETSDTGNESDTAVGNPQMSSASGAFAALLNDSGHDSSDNEAPASGDVKQVSHVSIDASNDAGLELMPGLCALVRFVCLPFQSVSSRQCLCRCRQTRPVQPSGSAN